MRTLTFLLLAFAFFASCKKDDDQASNNTGGGGNGGPNGTAHVDHWAPAVPYTDDTVTFTGTGFSAVASENHVFTCGGPLQVLNATSTQLRIRVPTDITSCIYFTDQSDIIVQANGWSDTLSGFQWKKVPRITELNYFAPYYCNALFRGGDSLEVVGIGFGPNSLASWSIGNFQSPGTAVVDTGILGFGYIRTRLWPSDLGSSNDECDTATVLVTLTNMDGRVFSKQTRIGHGPHMTINYIAPDFAAASRSMLIANGQAIYATVYGQYLKTCMTVRLFKETGPLDDLILTIGGPPEGFPNSYVLGPIDPSILLPGTYYYKPVDCDGENALFGDAIFTLDP